MSLDIMFLTHDNLRRIRKEPVILGLRYRGFLNGVENDQNTANQMKNGEVVQKRSSNSSNVSIQSSLDSQNDDYMVPKSIYNNHTKNDTDNGHHLYQHKGNNPLYGVNAANQYVPSALNCNFQQGQHQSKVENHSIVANDVSHSASIDNSNSSIRNPSGKRSNGDQRLSSKSSVPNGVRKSPEGQDNESYLHEDELDSKVEVLGAGSADSATYTTDNNGKINVHVTVMINAGTLADLKKQRSQIRTNGSPIEQQSNSSTANQSSNNSLEPSSPIMGQPPGKHLDAMPVQLNPLSLSSSSGTVPRFSGNTSEVVGDSRSRRCCIIM